MTRKPILFAFAVSAFWATAAMMNTNAATACPLGIVCPPVGAHKLHIAPAGLGMQTYGDNQSMGELHRGSPYGNDQFAIYVAEDNGDGSGTRARPRHHCSMVTIWHGMHRSPPVCLPRE